MNFPIGEVTKNKLVNLKGEHSFVWELIPSDLEQMERPSGFLEDFQKGLGLSRSKWQKFYKIGNRFWMNSDEVMQCSGIEFTSESKPIEFILGELHSDIDFYEDYALLNGEFWRILSIKEFFSEVGFSTLEKFDYCINCKKIDPAISKKNLKTSRRLHFSSLFKDQRDIESENSYQESESLLEEVISGDTDLFLAEAFIIIKAKSKVSLDLQTEEALGTFKRLDGIGFIEGRGLGYFFSSIMPGVEPTFRRAKTITSEYLSELLSLTRDFIHKDGFLLSSIGDNEVKFNLFDQGATNYNALITGTSGQGKSMIANKLLFEELKKGRKGLVLDLGNSFRKNALYNNAELFSDKINPMQFRSPAYLKEFIIAATGEVWNRKEEGRLFNAIKELVDQETHFDGFLNSLEIEFPGISYYFSEFAEFLSNDQVEIKDLSYCDLGCYPETFKAPLMIYLIEYFKNLEGHKIFVFDECWGLLENNASYIAECFRTFRKHNASAIAISQNMDDFSETQLGRVIIQNTFFKFLFAQNLMDSIYLSEFQKDLLSNVRSKKGDYSEFLVLSEGIQKRVRYYPSNFEYELFTSSKSDNEGFDRYLDEKGKYLSFSRAMKNYVFMKYPKYEEGSK